MDNDNRITVLYVHANSMDIGGADYCLFKLAAELDKNVFRPVVCLSQKTEILNLYKNEGIKTYLIDMERIKKSRKPLYPLKLMLKFIPTIRRIREIIEKENVDLVHGNDLLDIYGPIAGRFSKIPVTQYVRWILVSPDWLRNALTGIVYGINHVILTVSDGVANKMFSPNGKIRSNVVTCYDWIDMEKVGHCTHGKNVREMFGIPEGVSIVGSVGRLERWKGQAVFLRAAAEVAKKCPNTRFLVVGGPVSGRGRETYAAKLKELALELRIADRVIFTGYRLDIFDMMRSFDIFVHSSITPDPLPGVVMEAMYCSRPVIGADSGGVPEEIADGETGLLYRPGDHLHMVEKILKLLEDVPLARKMGDAGKKRVLEIFGKRKSCNRIENVYQKLVSYH